MVTLSFFCPFANIQSFIAFFFRRRRVPPLSGASISHYFNPTSQRLGLRVKGNSDTSLVEDSAMARNPFTQKMEGFTAVVPSVTQGNLSQKLNPINSAKSMSAEQSAMLSKWRGLKTTDLTDGLMEVRMPQEDGSSKVVMYNVPLVKTNGDPQPVAHSKFLSLELLV